MVSGSWDLGVPFQVQAPQAGLDFWNERAIVGEELQPSLCLTIWGIC